MHLAAESHMTVRLPPQHLLKLTSSALCVLLEVARKYWSALAKIKNNFRFHHIHSMKFTAIYRTPDEVENSVTPPLLLKRRSICAKCSPYSASKHPAIISPCPAAYLWSTIPTIALPIVLITMALIILEKLIPLVILNALKGKPLPIWRQRDQISSPAAYDPASARISLRHFAPTAVRKLRCSISIDRDSIGSASSAPILTANKPPSVQRSAATTANKFKPPYNPGTANTAPTKQTRIRADKIKPQPPATQHLRA